MDLDKTFAALASLIGALAGLIVAITALLKVLKRSSNRQTGKRSTKYKELRALTPFDMLMNSRRFLLGALLLIAGGAVIAFLILRVPEFQIDITNPSPNLPLTVKSTDEGANGEYQVDGNYSGELDRNNLRIYVLVRSAASPDEPWYIQTEQPEIIRKDSWFRKGQWSLAHAYVGRGEKSPEGKLKTGEVWNIVAVIASSTIDVQKDDGKVTSLKSLPMLKVESQLVTVRIGSIIELNNK
jgi:hypothetical protein